MTQTNAEIRALPVNAEGHALLSVNALAKNSEIDRRTITKRLKNVPPDDYRSGHPVYSIRTAGPFLWLGKNLLEDPREVLTFYQSEKYRLDVETILGKLIPEEEVHRVWSDNFKTLVLRLDTMSETLERDLGLTPEQVSGVDECVWRCKQQILLVLTGKKDAKKCAD